MFNLKDFRGVDDCYTVDTEAFERAVVEISKLGGSSSGHMTLFLTEDSEILGVEVCGK